MTDSENSGMQTQLERATVTQLPLEFTADAETAQLHEAWSALDELLAAAVPETPLPTFQPLDNQRDDRNAKMRVSTLAGVAAVAAALLLAVASWSVWRIGDLHPTPQLVKLVPPAAAKPAGTEITESDIANNPSAGVVAEDSALAWDDTFDQQLDQAWLCARQLQDGDSAIDTLRESVAGTVNMLQQELANGEAL